MSRLAIIGDIHNKQCKSPFEEKYREDVYKFVSDELKKKNLSKIIQLGDFFDNRKSIDLTVLQESKRVFRKYFNDFHSFISLAGNHDTYFKNTNELCSTEQLMLFQNFTTITEVTEFDNCLLVPWLNESNIESFHKAIENKKYKYCFGHFEINSFAKIKGFDETNGLSTAIFHNFEKVFSGHFHLTQDKGNICYVGSLFQNDRNDLFDVKRVIILDTISGALEEVRIPFELFHRVNILTEEEMTLALVETFQGKHVDVVLNTEKTLKREKFLDLLQEKSQGSFQYRVIDNSELCKEDVQLVAKNEEVVEIFQDYVKISEQYDERRKDSLKGLFAEVYSEVSQA
jgi:hypothetical protein